MLLELHGHELDSRAKVQGDLGPEPRTMHHQPKDVPQVLLSGGRSASDAPSMRAVPVCGPATQHSGALATSTHSNCVQRTINGLESRTSG